MKKSIHERIHNVGITMAIYTFILAWDNIIKANETKKSSKTNNRTDKMSFLPVISDEELLSKSFWKRNDLTYDLMLSFATRFLEHALTFDDKGNKCPHTIYQTTRKTLYPVQMDIVDYCWKTGMVSVLYAQNSIQSKVSRELGELTGKKKRESILNVEADVAVVCVNRQYKPYAVFDKRKSITEYLIKNINSVDEDNHLKFARLKKSIIYQLGDGGVVLFFDEQSHLKETTRILEKYVGESFLCDAFEIKGRLILLLDGTQEEIADSIKDLVDLVEKIYSAQHPIRKSVEIQ